MLLWMRWVSSGEYNAPITVKLAGGGGGRVEAGIRRGFDRSLCPRGRVFKLSCCPGVGIFEFFACP